LYAAKRERPKGLGEAGEEGMGKAQMTDFEKGYRATTWK